MRDAPMVKTLKGLRAAENACTRCPLYRNATQAVPGDGKVRSPIMMVGEQPGDKEDLAGRPFVGPAGRVLDKAMADAGLDRAAVFITNAVKHFKFEPRGKRRLHKKPNAYEIDRCRWWLDLERKIVKPQLMVALGATAARSISGRPMTVAKVRGRVIDVAADLRMLTTIHPSWLLRMEDQETKQREYQRFVADLRACAAFLAKQAA
jgi:DNA polymerase